MLTSAVTAHTGKIYFFGGNDYWRFDLARDAVDPGYPKPISRFWRGLSGRVDAAIPGQGDRARKIYFFQGREYIRYDMEADRVDPEYPKPIEGNWPGLGGAPIDAAITLPNGKLYFFRGGEYWRYDWEDDRVDPGYPKAVRDHWPGLPAHIDALVRGQGKRSHKVYAFEGDRYYRYDTRRNAVDAGYPREIETAWAGLTHDHKAAAHRAIERFRQRSGSGAWPNIPRGEVANIMKQRVDQPSGTDQGSRAFCGMAALIYALVKHQPDIYVSMCIQLYEEGAFRSKAGRVEPSITTRRARNPESPKSADWIMMAALRDDANAIFDVGSEANQFVDGITTPWEMRDWARSVLGYANVGYESCYIIGEDNALELAKKAYDKGGIGLLMIDGALIKEDKEITVGMPTHWVVFEGNLEVDAGSRWVRDSGHYKFDVWSWGKSTLHSVDAGEGLFEDAMYGAVSAW